ncbi:MAG: hypothetical protein KBD53_07070 [Candidatus Omnitrophica bacterium]|nr:hypothetical protein [Candidatus Omnitrophota bacterium]
MKGSIVLILIVCASVGFFAYNYISQENETSKEAGQTVQEKLAKSAGLIEEQAVQFSQKAGDITEDVQQQAVSVATTAKETTDNIALKVKELLEKAQDYLDNGDYKQAIESAKNTLKLNPASKEAKAILEEANAKLAVASEKVNEFKTGVSDKIGEAKASLEKK